MISVPSSWFRVKDSWIYGLGCRVLGIAHQILRHKSCLADAAQTSSYSNVEHGRVATAKAGSIAAVEVVAG